MKNAYLLDTDIDVKSLYDEIDMENEWEKWHPNMKGYGPSFRHMSRQVLLRHADASPTEVYSNYKELHKFLTTYKRD